MSLYEILLFGHITTAILWVGAGLSLVVLALLAERKGDDGGLRTSLDAVNRLANVWPATCLSIASALM